ncbi:Glutamate receptor 2.7 [Sesamum angolense]|uniref:Glutamate receptor n=1 Tax=Sesamum angolense TaxID=2727404 RepID=A0AAE1X3B9_9LAMI|nr:Glutamate receptor 2.7 [Sesamum angolense]
MRPLTVRVGVVLDLNSPSDVMVDSCMKMAVSDFYAANPDYSTELQLRTKYVGSVVDAYVAVLELLEKEEVHGIIGPLGYSTEETFFTELGQRVHVPIISFTARTSALSSAGKHYFIRTRPNDAVQAQALAVMCRGFEWSEVVVLYEDTEFGNQFLSHINKALEEVEIGLAYIVAFPSSAEDSYLLKQLNKLSTKQTRVFVVHMNPSLGFRLFTLAENAGVLREGFAWIVTDSISNFMNSVDSITRDSMQGVLGVRPHVPSSKELKSFQQRWKRNMILENTTSPITELNVHGLWAYDVVTALAIAIENIKTSKPFVIGANKSRDGTEKRKMRISTFGPKLLSELSSTKFRGLTGDFQLVDGELKPSAFEIFNVVGTGEKIVGYWTSDRGIKRELSESRSTEQLKSIMWPGDSVIRPKGWAIPTAGNLRVGIPSTRGYREFVNVTIDPTTKHTNATGFSIDIFLAALDVIPFPVNYEFHHYNDTQSIDWTYDDMLHEIPQRFDMVVGDTTIWAPRVAYVDFALHILNQSHSSVLHILERRVTSNGTDSLNSKKERPRMIYWSPLAVLAFPERNMVSNKWSFFILLVWLFMAFILMQSYTANLSAILTVDQLKFAFSDNYYIGNVFGKQKRGIDAIFDEVPYMKAFPIGSPLVSHFSKAIMDVTQGPNMTSIEQKNFGPGYSSQDPLSSSISQQTSSLTFYDFAGLFVIVGSVTILALLCSETAVGRKLTDKAKHVIFNCYNYRTTQVNSMENANGDGDSRSQGRREIHHAMQNNVSNPEENTDPHAIGDMEPREIGQSHETSCAQIRSES